METESQTRSVEPARSRFDVLIVEDDKVLSDQLQELLSDAGYRVRTTGHGQAALAFLSSHPVDLVILDLMLPVMTGWEFLEHVRASEAHRNLPIFIITAVQNLSRAQGAGPVFLKPLNVPSLLRAVRARLGAR